MKKHRLLIFILIVIFLFYIFINYLPKNYTFTYEVSDLKITEEYDKEKNAYYFKIDDDKIKIDYALYSKYYNKRKLIKEINIKDDCYYFKSDVTLDFHVCQKNNKYYSSYYNEIKSDDVIDTYANINFYKKTDDHIFIWNYKNFLVLNDGEKEEVSLFDKDLYELSLITKYNEYLAIPDYNETYNFNKLYLINSDNLKIKELKLDRKIYFNSYILGIDKKYLYIYDLEVEKIYKVNLSDGEVEIAPYALKNDDKWEDVSPNKLNKKNLAFQEKEKYFAFIIKNNSLYYKTPINEIHLTSLKVKHIVYQNATEAYFISDDILYYVNLENGIYKIAQNSEWNFNFKNIYVFE